VTYRSWEELMEAEKLQCFWSDYYKDYHGFRPRWGTPEQLASVEWLNEQIASIDRCIEQDKSTFAASALARGRAAPANGRVREGSGMTTRTHFEIEWSQVAADGTETWLPLTDFIDEYTEHPEVRQWSDLDLAIAEMKRILERSWADADTGQLVPKDDPSRLRVVGVVTTEKRRVVNT
jgi:hypothetical protein